jgi:hypothetical protein
VEYPQSRKRDNYRNKAQEAQEQQVLFGASRASAAKKNLKK